MFPCCDLSQRMPNPLICSRVKPFIEKQYKVYKPECFLQEMESDLVLDASPGPKFYDDPPFIDLTRNLTHDAVPVEHGPLGQIPGTEKTSHKKDLDVVLISNSSPNSEDVR